MGVHTQGDLRDAFGDLGISLLQLYRSTECRSVPCFCLIDFILYGPPFIKPPPGLFELFRLKSGFLLVPCCS